MDKNGVNGYVCPNCGGTIKFNIRKQKFACASCGADADIKPAKDFVEEYPIETCDTREAEGEVFEGLKSVICRNCGSEVIFGDNQTAAVCPMCGSSQVMAQKQSAGISPDGIIPFKVDRKDAEEKFRQWINKRWFAPNKLKTAYQSGRLTGMYIPFWTYDFDVEAVYHGEGGIIRQVRDRDGKTHTHTEWHSVSGTVEHSFDDVPVCASNQAVSKVIGEVQPYSTSVGSLPYDAAYLSGFCADHYTISCRAGLEKAKSSVKPTLENEAHNDIMSRGYDSANVSSLDCVYNNTVYKHVMLPAWVSAFTYNNKTYKYVINGETGKVGGERPYSVIKIILAIAAALAVLFGVYCIFERNAKACSVNTYETVITEYTNSKENDIIDNREEDYYGMVWTR